MTGTDESQPALYGELAPWFHLLTSPDDYAPGAEQALSTFTDALGRAPSTVLELGSGGGNHALHMKAGTTLTLTDLSPAMLELSRSINPECEHVQGDMRTLRLDRTFDAVFTHDAIDYMVSEDDLRAAMQTAFVHVRPGGIAMFEPDHVRETFVEATDHGGHDGSDGDARSLRYLMWTWDPDPDDTWYFDDFAYLLREVDGSVRTVADRHQIGLYARATWFELLEKVGFTDVRTGPTGYDDDGHDIGTEAFVARKPAE